MSGQLFLSWNRPVFAPAVQFWWALLNTPASSLIPTASLTVLLAMDNPLTSTQTILYSSSASHGKQAAKRNWTTITKTTEISLCTQSRGSITGEWLGKSPFTVLSFDTFPHLHSIGRAARRNTQRKKTCQRGQRTEKRKWKGRQGHELWFHLHCPPQFFHRKACVAIKQWGQLLKHALSHWTARQESIDSLLLTNRSRTHREWGRAGYL